MNPRNLKICLFPMEIKWEDKAYNLSNLEEKIEFIHPETDLLVLPETFSTGFPSGRDKEQVRLLAERNTGSTISHLKYLSKKYNIAIAGTFIADSGGSLYNRAFFIEPSGDEYFEDKRHLFTMGGENQIFSKGYDRLHVRFRGWNIDLVVCYDIRFPVWCRNFDNRYDLLITVANWPITRIDAWIKLLFARAIENEAYVVGVNCKGEDPKGIKYDGSSMTIDFKGQDISFFDESSGLLYASLSYERLQKFRDKFPAWRDADKFQIT